MGIIHTGTWEWRSGFGPSATPDGDCSVNPMTCTAFWYGNIDHPFDWGFGYDGFTHISLAAGAGTLRFNWSATGLFLDGVLQDPQSLPAGFRVHDDYHFILNLSGPGVGAELFLNVEFRILGIDLDIDDFHPYDIVGQLSGFGDNSTINRLALLGIGGWEMIFSANHPAYPTWGGTHFIISTVGPKFTGVFDIVMWWWTLPQTDPCGNTNEPRTDHLIFAGDQPPTPDGSFGEYEKLDPDDPDAFPQPVIEFLNPNHGRGGTAVEIHGRGFGDDANVQFDGVDATDIVVQSQYLITCKAPGHANGFATVAVINPDGVST